MEHQIQGVRQGGLSWTARELRVLYASLVPSNPSSRQQIPKLPLVWHVFGLF
jgi:hypothetical protein